jgi:hypothetical protein
MRLQLLEDRLNDIFYGTKIVRRKPSQPGPKVRYEVEGWPCMASNAKDAGRQYAVEVEDYPRNRQRFIEVRSIGGGWYKMSLTHWGSSTLRIRRLKKGEE